MRNAIELADLFAVAQGDIDTALRRWEPAQLDAGNRLRLLGQRLGIRSGLDTEQSARVSG